MALQIISVVLFTVFFSEALTLMCFNCTDTNIPAGACTQTANCSSSSQCSSVTTYNVGHYFDEKSCAAAACFNLSINVGLFGMSSKCCSSDFCNNATDSENGLSCDTLKCKGDEKKCITAAVGYNGTNSTVKGCTSQNICNNSTIVSSALPRELIIFNVSCLDANNMTLPVSAGTSTFPTFFHLKSGFLLVLLVFGCSVLSV